MSKLDFKPTVYDSDYYKNKFPYFDDAICDILEKCSLEKDKEFNTQPPKETKKTKDKGTFKIEHIETVIRFD
jgi:hypothetical protein